MGARAAVPGVRRSERNERKPLATRDRIHPAAKIFLQKPLRTSVYVDIWNPFTPALSVCRETGGCEEVKRLRAARRVMANCKYHRLHGNK
ncbi:hypothetical protein PRIPAC_80145 [Pristionchus pacificus]|uniref:Uncharacterized protein n=1 Tax=Pristionchus pacificus TaxID=54126 RepID=A0A2A6BVX9_PRIPA|nr:hypothetical protein PRIPAC_80145 [Pristionchus pacificus]|eukprot:PDM70028.1 hypothetical protein PRIPAC_49240 [Pristionchus pacificus]